MFGNIFIKNKGLATFENNMNYSLKILILYLISGGLFLILKFLFPLSYILHLAASIPFLLILPGWLLSKIFLPALNILERMTLSVLFSMIVNYSSLFLGEKILEKMSDFWIMFIVLMTNIICLVFYCLYPIKKSNP